MEKKTLILIIIVIILFISIIYYQDYLQKNEITSSTVKTTGSVIQEIEDDTKEIKENIEKEIIPVEEITEPIIEKEFPKTFLTDVKCNNGKEITFTLNNILNKQIIPSKLMFYAAGYTIRNPVCDKIELNAKESTDCKLDLRIKLNKIIKFTIAYPAKSQSVNIDCG